MSGRSGNPFEDSGLSRDAIEALSRVDPVAIGTALGGLRRVLTAALHQDRTGIKSPFYERFLASTSRIINMPPEDQQTLARAYAIPPKSTRRKAESVTTDPDPEDLGRGELINDMINMILGQEKSIETVSGVQILLWPVSFSGEKPKDTPRDAPQYSWYPPQSSMMPLVHVDENGKLLWQELEQVSFKLELAKHNRHMPKDSQFTEYMRRLTAIASNAMQDTISRQGIDIGEYTSVTLHKQVGTLHVHRPFDGLRNTLLASGDIRDSEFDRTLPDGLYTIGYGAGYRQGQLHETSYRIRSNDQLRSSMLVVGTIGSSYISDQQKTIYDKPPLFGSALPTRYKAVDLLPRFVIPVKAYSRIAPSFTPRIETGRLLVATDEEGRLGVVGRIAHIYSLSA